jgi:hypothetical protein
VDRISRDIPIAVSRISIGSQCSSVLSVPAMELYCVRSKWKMYIKEHSDLIELSLADVVKALCEELKNNDK